MCILCYELAGDEHWSQAGGRADAASRRRRRELAGTVLATYGLKLTSDLSGLADVVADRKGRATVVRGLGELWPAAQRLVGRPLDPLDPDLLDHLAASADGRRDPAR
jgi:hypothetical protein